MVFEFKSYLLSNVNLYDKASFQYDTFYVCYEPRNFFLYPVQLGIKVGLIEENQQMLKIL
jgi:hypothetical protein